MTTALAALCLLAWLWLLALHGRFWLSRPELPPAMPARAPSVAIVVPARDEAETIGAAIASLLAQDYPGPLSVTLVDDGSSDGTAAVARALPDPQRRLFVLRGQERPAGWAGKLWAVHQGVAATDSELVLLTDADIVHAPAHLATLVAGLEREGADMVSEMVRLNRESAAEQALVPAFVYFFQLLYPFARVNDPRARTAGAAGGTVLLKRATLARAGGIAAIKGALIDDCALAARIKPRGPIWLGHATQARSVRRYPGFADIWRMIARSAYVQLRRSPLLLLASTLGMALLFLAPPALALFAKGWPELMAAIAWLAMAASFRPTLHRYGASPTWGIALPLIALFYMAATIGSALDHHLGRGVTWKSRAYQS